MPVSGCACSRTAWISSRSFMARTRFDLPGAARFCRQPEPVKLQQESGNSGAERPVAAPGVQRGAEDALGHVDDEEDQHRAVDRAVERRIAVAEAEAQPLGEE